MDVKVKKVAIGFVGVTFIAGSILFWSNESDKTMLRERATAQQTTFQSKVMPVEKKKKETKAQAIVAVAPQKKAPAPVVKNLVVTPIKQAVEQVKSIQNVLNIKLKKETALIADKTVEEDKLEIAQDSKTTALKLKRSTTIHLTQAL